MAAKHALTPVLAVALAAALLLVPLPGSWRGLWQSKLLDLGHVPLFAGLTVFLWRFMGSGLARPIALAVALAVLTEALQAGVGRSADLSDLLRGVLGVVAGAAGIAAWQARERGAVRAGWLLVVAAAVAWPLGDALPYLIDAWEGSRDFPTLAHFETDRELLRWRSKQADIERVTGADTASARITFHPGPEPYPYAALRPIRRDFASYRELCVALMVTNEPLELVLSLRSGSGEEDQTTHYQEARRLTPGRHTLRVNLAAVAPRAGPLPLDLADVWIIQLFMENPAQPRTIDLQRVWLE